LNLDEAVAVAKGLLAAHVTEEATIRNFGEEDSPYFEVCIAIPSESSDFAALLSTISAVNPVLMFWTDLEKKSLTIDYPEDYDEDEGRTGKQ